MYRLRITSNQATSEPGNESSEDRKTCLALSGTSAGSAIWEILSDHILELGPEPKVVGEMLLFDTDKFLGGAFVMRLEPHPWGQKIMARTTSGGSRPIQRPLTLVG